MTTVNVLEVMDLATEELRVDARHTMANALEEARAAVAELIEANKLLVDSISPKMCYRNEKERESYRRINNIISAMDKGN